MEWLQYLQSLGVILLILSLLPLFVHLYKKYQQGVSGPSHIKILEVKPIGPKAQLLLVEIEGKRLLLGLSDKGLNLLWELKNES